MPKPAHTRVTLSGVIGSAIAPLEEWSFGLNYPAAALSTNGTQVVDDAIAEEVATAFDTHLAGWLSTDQALTQVRVVAIGADGLYETRPDGSYAAGGWVGEHAGGLPPLTMPLQTALCVSLVTGRAGPTGKGRFFLPWPGANISAVDKRLAEATAQQIIGSTSAFVNAVSGIMTFPPQVVSSKGYMSAVTSLRMGRVPDTMRSRREDLAEGYVAIPLA